MGRARMAFRDISVLRLRQSRRGVGVLSRRHRGRGIAAFGFRRVLQVTRSALSQPDHYPGLQRARARFLFGAASTRVVSILRGIPLGTPEGQVLSRPEIPRPSAGFDGPVGEFSRRVYDRYRAHGLVRGRRTCPTISLCGRGWGRQALLSIARGKYCRNRAGFAM